MGGGADNIHHKFYLHMWFIAPLLIGVIKLKHKILYSAGNFKDINNNFSFLCDSARRLC